MLRVLVLAVLVVAMLVVACDGDDTTESTADATSIATQEPADTSVGEPTGIPDIDRALATVFSGDEPAVEALIEYTPTACEAEPAGLGSPPMCLDGESDGELIDVFPQAQCEGFYARPEDMGTAIESLTVPGPNLRAVFTFANGWPPGDYIAIYDGVGNDRPADWVFAVILSSDGTIVGVHWGCAQTYEAFVEFQDLEDPLYVAEAYSD